MTVLVHLLPVKRQESGFSENGFFDTVLFHKAWLITTKASCLKLLTLSECKGIILGYFG